MDQRVRPRAVIRSGNRRVWVPARPFSYLHLRTTTHLHHAYTFQSLNHHRLPTCSDNRGSLTFRPEMHRLGGRCSLML